MREARSPSPASRSKPTSQWVKTIDDRSFSYMAGNVRGQANPCARPRPIPSNFVPEGTRRTDSGEQGRQDEDHATFADLGAGRVAHDRIDRRIARPVRSTPEAIIRGVAMAIVTALVTAAAMDITGHPPTATAIDTQHHEATTTAAITTAGVTDRTGATDTRMATFRTTVPTSTTRARDTDIRTTAGIAAEN